MTLNSDFHPTADASPRGISARIVATPRAVTESIRYSRFVGMMKLVLPLGALILVAMVVAWPYLRGTKGGIPLSFNSIGVGLDENVFMTNARYIGADGKGQPYTLTAELAAQDEDDPDIIQLTKPQADILLNQGSWLALTANSGTLKRQAETLALVGAVNIFSDQGYEFRTESALIDLAASLAHGTVPVEAQGPFGTLNADSFRMADDGKTIYFEGQVRMTLYPKAGT
jgi:lipopolysaccharide export system protein LptC